MLQCAKILAKLILNSSTKVNDFCRIQFSLIFIQSASIKLSLNTTYYLLRTYKVPNLLRKVYTISPNLHNNPLTCPIVFCIRHIEKMVDEFWVTFPSFQFKSVGPKVHVLQFKKDKNTQLKNLVFFTFPRVQWWLSNFNIHERYMKCLLKVRNYRDKISSFQNHLFRRSSQIHLLNTVQGSC